MHIITSLDIWLMYPSIKYSTVTEAINFYSKDFRDEEKGILKYCLDMITFGMGNTFITFIDELYE